MTNFTEGRLQAYERMMRDTGKRERRAEETSSGKTFTTAPRHHTDTAKEEPAART